MKKLAILLAVPMILAGCGSNPTPSTNPYTIAASNFGYTATIDPTTGIVTYTVPGTTFQLYSAAGAPGVREIKFTAVLLDKNGTPLKQVFAKDEGKLDDDVITPLNGNIFGNGGGGFQCIQTLPRDCTPFSKVVQNNVQVNDVIIKDTGPDFWPQNRINRSFVPIDWAAAHFTNGAPAGWSIDITYTAYQSNGGVVTWKDNYQFVYPAAN